MEMTMRSYEIAGVGFCGSSDETDNRIVWVSAQSREQVERAIDGTGATLCGELPKDIGSIDYELPRDHEKLQARLEEFMHWNGPDYWYTHRHELSCGDVFRTATGSLVKLDGRVPGDGTKWYVAEWDDGWMYCHAEIEPGDLRGGALKDPQVEQSRGRDRH